MRSMVGESGVSFWLRGQHENAMARHIPLGSERGERSASPHDAARTDRSRGQRFLLVGLFLLTCLGGLDLRGQAPQPTRPEANGDLRVETYCSKVSPGVGIADVSWKESQTSVSRGARDTTTRVQLLVTSVKDGFSTGAAVKVWPSSGKERVGSGLGASDHRLDPLRGLVVAPAPNSVASGRSPSKSPQASQQERSNSIRIQNLQPGINYIWRLQRVHDGTLDSSNTVTTAAPVCAVDFKK